MDILEQGSNWLEAQRHRHRTREVTYRRQAASVVLQATVGRTEFEKSDSQGIVMESQSRDYLLRTQDLILDGQATLPQRGDRIEEVDGAQTHIYEVLPLGSEPPWRYSDPYRQTLRIHTQAIDVEE